LRDYLYDWSTVSVNCEGPNAHDELLFLSSVEYIFSDAAEFDPPRLRDQAFGLLMSAISDSAAVPAVSLRTVRFYVNLTFFLTFFPSLIDFVFNSQTQPLAGAAALPLLFLQPIRLNRTTIPVLIALAVIAAYMVGSLLIFPENTIYILAHGTSYMLNIVVLLAMWDKLHLLNANVYRWALALWVAVGVVQVFPVPSAIKDGFLLALKPLVAHERFTMGLYSGGGRGYDLLAPEPSIAAPTILYFALTAVFLRDRGMMNNRSFIWSLVQVAMLAAVNRSGSLAVLSGLAFLGWNIDAVLYQNSRNRGLAIAVLVGSVIALPTLITVLPDDVRAALALRSIAAAMVAVGDFRQLFVALVYVGGARILLVVSGYASLLDNYGMGHGIASWMIDWYFTHVASAVGITQDQFVIAGLDESGVSTKPATFFGVIAFDTGLLGLVPCAWALISAFFWRSVPSGRTRRRFLYLMPAAAWMSLFIVAVLNSPWMLACYAISYFLREGDHGFVRADDAAILDS